MTERHDNLALAERHLAEGTARLVRQAVLIGRLRAAGRSTVAAEGLLVLLEVTLIEMHKHREMILAELERERRGLSRMA